MSDEKDFGASSNVYRAVVEGFGAALDAKDDRDAARREAQAELEQRMAALRRARANAAAEQELSLKPVREAIGAYCSGARKEMAEELKRGGRMPVRINYLERYGALTKMQDRNEVLRRIEQTVDMADKAIQEAGAVDVPGALGEAAAGYRRRLMLLDGIVAGAAALFEPDEDDPVAAGQAPRGQGSTDLAKVAEDAFLAAMGELPADQARLLEQQKDTVERKAALAERLDATGAQVGKVVQAVRRMNAQQASGTALDLGGLPEFTGKVSAEQRCDPEKLCELVGLVRTSFKTFSQVVHDNGLFAAFAAEGSYGACSGYREPYLWWWDDPDDFDGDFEYDGPRPSDDVPDDIPTDVEEAEGGDSLDQCLERMRAFSKRRYWGMLDDDFRQHVDAFWYGFKKLMGFTNGLFSVNDKSFRTYCDTLADQTLDAALDFASAMDDSQVEAFCKEVERRKRRWDETDRDE